MSRCWPSSNGHRIDRTGGAASPSYPKRKAAELLPKHGVIEISPETNQHQLIRTGSKQGSPKK